MPEVDVWQASTAACPPSLLPGLMSLLTPDEQARAARFRNPADERTFVASHAMLRLLLAQRLATPPASIRLASGANGKPLLPDSPWQFNLSHSGPWIVCAIASGIQVGVDVETLRPVPEMNSIATRYFSPAEQTALFALPPAERQQAFFRLWTLKEAYLKATGDGLSFPLADFDVQVEPPTLLRVANRPEEPRRWTFNTFTPAPGCTAALCAASGGSGIRIHPWEW